MPEVNAVILTRFALAILMTLNGSGESAPHSQATNEDSSLILINVSVTAANGQVVRGLPQEAFQVFEEDVPQDIEFFSRDYPLSIGIVFDITEDTKTRLDLPSGTEAAWFLQPLMDVLDATGQDQAILLELTDDATLVEGATDMLNRLTTGEANANKILLLISDTGRTRDFEQFNRFRDAIHQTDVQLHSVGIGTNDNGAFGRSGGRNLLRDASEETGGGLYVPGSIRDVPAVMVRVADTLRYQQVLGYRSSNTDGIRESREVEVRLDRSALDVPSDFPELTLRYKSSS